MKQEVVVERVPFFTDVRGVVLEPIGCEALPLQRNVHIVLTEPGHIRGNHFHERGSEVTVALGPGLFRYRDGTAIRDIRIGVGEAMRFHIPPGIAHAFLNTGRERSLLIGFNTEAHNPLRPDVVRDVLIEPGEAREG
jgi:dTDP-4-dehydrorhamnose 3,5-epimerase-like enzyme